MTKPSPSRVRSRLAGLAPGDLKQLSERRSFRPLVALTVDWSLIIGSFSVCASTDSTVVWTLAWLLIGRTQHALAILGHDGTHGLLSPRRTLNGWLTRWLCWGPLGVSADGYRRLHFEHHRRVGTPEDPEHVALPKRPYGLPMTLSLPWRSAALAAVGGAVSELLLFQRHARPRNARELSAAVVVPVAMWALGLAFGVLWIPLLWMSCTFTSFFIFSRLRAFSEHLGSIEHEHTNRYATPLWLRWFSHPHCSDHHWEHHHWPSVPYYRLPELRRVARGPEIVGLGDLWRRCALANASGPATASSSWLGRFRTNLSRIPRRSRIGEPARRGTMPAATTSGGTSTR